MDVIVKKECTASAIDVGDVIKLDMYDNMYLVCRQDGVFFLQALSGLGSLTVGNIYATISEMLEHIPNVLEVYKSKDYQLVLERK